MPGRKNTTWCWTWALQREGLVRKEDSWESRINEQREDEKRIKKRRIWETANETERKRKWRAVPPFHIFPGFLFHFCVRPIFNPLRPIGTCRSSSHHPICLLTFTCPCCLPPPISSPSHGSWISATCRSGRCCEISLLQVQLGVIGQQDDERMEWVMRRFAADSRGCGEQQSSSLGKFFGSCLL